MIEVTLAEVLLKDFTLSEILEMNNLTEEDVLQILVEGGLIDQPERVVAEFEAEEEP